MKVLLLGFCKIAYMPYMYFYLDQLKKISCDIHLLYWKRDSRPDSELPEGVTAHVFDCYQEDSVPLIRKVVSFLKYRRYTLGILKRVKFDLVIVLHSTPGIVIFDILIKRFKGKFILDYRDFTYENLIIYKKIINKLVNRALATFVSSDGYRKYLPKIGNIYTSHNLLLSSLENRIIINNRKESYPIRIRFWGFIRHEKINTAIIDKLANDDRFELHYHGREQETGQRLRKYCEEKKFKNIFFHGEYKPEERYIFAEETDLLHNIYENDIKTTNAMGNKYYDGITFYIPQLCNEGSFMGEQVIKNGVGCECNPYSESFADDIYDYNNSLNWTIFNNNCDNTLNRILAQYNAGIDILNKFIEEGKGGVNEMFKDKTLLITGGTGSFGNVVLRRFLNTDIREIRIFSRDEKKQDDMRHTYNNDKIKYYIGDVRDLQSIKNAINGVDYVFHAAALKQVPSCEFFPLEAVKTNVIGTDNVLTACIEAGVKKVICLSTDKAAYPVNAMGTSKAMMEKVLIAKSKTVASDKTLICGTRYGNVMCSRGSVIPLFIEQIKAKQPLTITEPKMTRFIMSLEEAVELVIFAFENAEGGDILVQKAPATTIEVLAQAVKSIFHADNDIKIIGIRHGEKIYETLLTNEECSHAIDMGNFYRVPADKRELNYDKYFKDGNQERANLSEFNSNNAELLTLEETKEKLLKLSYIKEEIKAWEDR